MRLSWAAAVGVEVIEDEVVDSVSEERGLV